MSGDPIDIESIIAEAEKAVSDDREVRSPTSSPHAEAMMLGCVLAKPDLMTKAQLLVGREHFTQNAHRAIWWAMTQLHEEGSAVDEMLVAQQLSTKMNESKSALEQIGGTETLGRLRKLATNPMDQFQPTAALLAERLRRRSVGYALQTGIMELDAGHDAATVVSSFAERTARLQSTASDDEASWASTLAKEVMRDLETGTPQLTTISSGIEAVDLLLGGGFAPGLHYIIGALSGHGKTTFGSAVVAGILHANENVYVDWYGCEVPPKWQFCRIASAWADVPEAFWKSETDKTSAELYRRAVEALGFGVGLHDRLRVMRKSPIDMRAVALRTAIRRQAIGDAPLFVVVDYLQRATDGRSHDKTGRISGASTMLADLAEDENTCTIAMSQFTDAPSNDEPIPLPKPGHARWAKEIHHDACDWITYHRPGLESFESLALIQLAKSRYGHLGHTWMLGTPSNRFVPLRSAGSSAVKYCKTNYGVDINAYGVLERFTPQGLNTREIRP